MKTLSRRFAGVLLCCIALLFVVPLAGLTGSQAFAGSPAAAGAALVAADSADVAPVAAEAAGVDDGGLIATVLSLAPQWLQALSLLIAACAAVAALTPTPKDDGVILVLRRVIDYLAFNFGGAKNAGSSKSNSNRL